MSFNAQEEYNKQAEIRFTLFQDEARKDVAKLHHTLKCLIESTPDGDRKDKLFTMLKRTVTLAQEIGELK